jgi:hypothetical protein
LRVVLEAAFAFPFLPLVVDVVVALEVVVMMLSSTSAIISSIDIRVGASDMDVRFDCVDSRDPFELLDDLAFFFIAGFLVAAYSSTSAKKRQSSERFRCSSLVMLVEYI